MKLECPCENTPLEAAAAAIEWRREPRLSSRRSSNPSRAGRVRRVWFLCVLDDLSVIAILPMTDSYWSGTAAPGGTPPVRPH